MSDSTEPTKNMYLEFEKFKQTMLFHSLRLAGYNIKPEHFESISREEQEKMWLDMYNIFGGDDMYLYYTE